MDKFYASEPQEDFLEAALSACVQLHMMLPEGDILCFLPGREDIEHVHKALSEKKFPPGFLKARPWALRRALRFANAQLP